MINFKKSNSSVSYVMHESTYEHNDPIMQTIIERTTATPLWLYTPERFYRVLTDWFADYKRIVLYSIDSSCSEKYRDVTRIVRGNSAVVARLKRLMNLGLVT